MYHGNKNEDYASMNKINLSFFNKMATIENKRINLSVRAEYGIVWMQNLVIERTK